MHHCTAALIHLAYDTYTPSYTVLSYDTKHVDMLTFREAQDRMVLQRLLLVITLWLLRCYAAILLLANRLIGLRYEGLVMIRPRQHGVPDSTESY